MLDAKLMRLAAAMSSAVLLKGILIFGGYWLGSRLDVLAGTAPLFMLIGILLGVCVGMWYLITVFNRLK